MSPFVLLRVAAVIAFLFFLGHTLGAPWTPGQASVVSGVVASMKAAQLPEIQPGRTYWDFYFGFGTDISILLFALSAVLWQTASLARTSFGNARPFMASLFVCYLAVGAVGFRFFFILPAIMSGAICLCIVLAWWLGSRPGKVA